MDIHIIVIISFFILLMLSAIFSGSETAFFSMDQLKIDKLSNSRKQNDKRVVRLLKNPGRLLVSILIGNTLVNVFAASIAAFYTNYICIRAGFNIQLGFIFNILIVTFFILVISEITPKIFAVKNPEKFSSQLSIFVHIVYILFLPVSYVIVRGFKTFTRQFDVSESSDEKLLHANEIQALLELGEEQGELEKEEREMINSIFEFGDTVVREIMIPRTDMVCASYDTTVEEIIKLIKEKGHTRIPVYKDSIDKIQGIINAKDLLPLTSNAAKDIDILKLARTCIFVPEAKKIDDLLRLFQKERQHMAVVVDEYGGTAGLVTLEDVIEEIVGDIRDEYDQEQSLYRKIDDLHYIVNAKIDAESLNDLIDIDIPIQDDYDTLGGFILEMTGSVPHEKDIIRHRNWELSMEKVEKNRIVLVKLTKHLEKK